MKYAVSIAIVLVLLWLLRTVGRRGRADASAQKQGPEATNGASQEDRAALPMLRCAHCGVHLPGQDAIVVRGTAYCTDEHRRVHESSRS
jgi:uncharacterized protein